MSPRVTHNDVRPTGAYANAVVRWAANHDAQTANQRTARIAAMASTPFRHASSGHFNETFYKKGEKAKSQSKGKKVDRL